jgi:hypothetical protein
LIVVFAVTVVVAVLTMLIVAVVLPARSGEVQVAISGTVGIASGVIGYASARGKR